jgi:hypothetical protein
MPRLQCETAADVDQNETELPSNAAGETAGGDSSRLRGIPAVGRHTSGTMFGTDPVRALLAKERRLRC